MTQFIQSTPGTIAAAMGYQSQVPQSMYPTGQLALAGGGIADFLLREEQLLVVEIILESLWEIELGSVY